MCARPVRCAMANDLGREIGGVGTVGLRGGPGGEQGDHVAGETVCWGADTSEQILSSAQVLVTAERRTQQGPQVRIDLAQC